MSESFLADNAADSGGSGGSSFLADNAGGAAAPAGSSPAAPKAPAPQGPPATAAATGAAKPPAWLGALDEETRGFIENKGWKEPGDVLRSYRQLEEYLGADKAGRGLALPKDENDKEGWEKVWTALGRPKTPEGYELNGLMAQETADPAFMGFMSETMLSAGLSKAQGQKLAAAYQAHWKADVAARVEAHQRDKIEAARDLSAEDKENCRRGFRFLELNNEDAAAIETYWGVKRAAQLFAKIGQALGEDKRVDGSGGGGFSGSAEAASARIAELKADPVFSKRYLDGEPAAFKQMEDLHKRAAEANK